MSQQDFDELEGEARGGAILAVIIVIGTLCFLSGAGAGWIGRGLWG